MHTASVHSSLATCSMLQCTAVQNSSDVQCLRGLVGAGQTKPHKHWTEGVCVRWLDRLRSDVISYCSMSIADSSGDQCTLVSSPNGCTQPLQSGPRAAKYMFVHQRSRGPEPDHRSAVPTRQWVTLTHARPADLTGAPQVHSAWLQCTDSQVRSVHCNQAACQPRVTGRPS
jgi:hypothetical protein